MKKTLLALTAMALLAMMPVVAAGSSEAPKSAPAESAAAPAPVKYADEIVFGKLSEPLTLDPNGAGVGGSEVGVTQQIYEGLVYTDTDGDVA